MQGFRLFLEASDEAMSDLKKTLAKLPESHRDLVKGYTLKLEPGNTLKRYPDHVGRVDAEKKTLTIAAPWNYGREQTILHEIGHLVWAILSPEIRKSWADLVHTTQMKDSDRQNPEELFAMSYGATYSKHPPLTYYRKEWVKFIQNLPS